MCILSDLIFGRTNGRKPPMYTSLPLFTAIRMPSLINVGAAGARTSRPTELGKLIVVFQERHSISSTVEKGPRDIEQRYTLFALAINQRSRALRYQASRESNSFGRSAPTWDSSLLRGKKNFPVRYLLSANAKTPLLKASRSSLEGSRNASIYEYQPRGGISQGTTPGNAFPLRFEDRNSMKCSFSPALIDAASS